MKNKCLLLILTVVLLSSCVSSNRKIVRKQRAVRSMGEAHMAKGNFTGALKYLLEAETIYANDHLLHDDLGKVYVAKEKYGLAVTHFKKAISIEPNFAPGKNNLGSAYLLAGNWDEAIKVFEELSSDLLYATPHYPAYNLGWAYYNKKDYKKALKYFKKSLKLKRNFVLALRGTGLVYAKIKKPGLSVKYLKRASIKAPKFQQLHFDLGTAYALGKKYKQAIEVYSKVMLIKPDSDLADLAQEEILRLKKKKTNS